MKIFGLFIGIGLIAGGVVGLFVGLFLLYRQRLGGRLHIQPFPVPLNRAHQGQDEQAGLPSDPPDHAVETFVMGQRDVNPDGTPRQDIIATLSVGDRLTLGHQPTKFDPNAIAVSAAGGTIGYLPSKHSEVLIGLLEETSSVSAAVKRIVEDEVNQSLVRGVWMRIELRGLQARQIDKAQGEDTGEDGEVTEADC